MRESVSAQAARKVLPPDFRYVWLVPTSSRSVATLGASTAALAALSGGLWGTGYPSLSFALTLGASALAALALVKSDEALPARRGAREAAMAIVPWGIIVEPDTDPHVLRWPAVRKVSVDVSRARRGGAPAVLSSLVTIETDGGCLAGRATGAVELERLLVNLEAYAEESARPIARDLAGSTMLGTVEPVFSCLLHEARRLCSTARGATELGLPTGGYRQVTARRAGPKTTARLRLVLRSNEQNAADPRALAAVLAGELDAVELIPELVSLVTCPHPSIAALAKAAALRLGGSRARAGAVREVAAFLAEGELDAMTRWSERQA
jgi:hypothetical protein